MTTQASKTDKETGMARKIEKELNAETMEEKCAQMQEKHKGKKERTWKIATWNIRGLLGKENELMEEFLNASIDILGITETKKKGIGEEMLEGGHTLIYSGVQQTCRAKEGVGCIIRQENMKFLKKWTAISERILRIEMKIDDISTTLIIAYGPNENEAVVNKNRFWEQMSEQLDDNNDRVIIIGDLNGRVGKKDGETGEVIGKQGEDMRNDNGRRLIDLCLENNLIITNTFFNHKDIHKFTREVKSRGEKSIIDYVIINRPYRSEVKDTRVKRGPEIFSDHYLLEAKIVTKTANKSKDKKKQDTNGGSKKQIIRVYKLREEQTAKIYKSKVEEALEINRQNLTDQSLEVLWTNFKETLLEAAKGVCGCIKTNPNNKQTSWWNEEVKKEIKSKKCAWKNYLSNNSAANYEIYKKQRAKAKETVKEAKVKSWEEFSNKLEQDRIGNQKLFYKVLKNMRKGKQAEIRLIKAKTGEILDKEDEIMNRWREYFESILNVEKINSDENEEEGEAVEDILPEHNARISVAEVMEACKKLKRGKAAGADGITSEMIINLEKNGWELLTELYNKMWTEGKIVKEMEVGIILPVYKKGDKRECSNYRGITLLSTMVKIYERILEKRVKLITEGQMEEAQCGFRKGRGVQDHIFTIKQLIEKSGDGNIYMAFLDLEKAFDSVSRKTVWAALERRGVRGDLLKAIRSLYDNTRNYVRTANLQSTEFLTKEGVRQGGVLSPTLFNIVMDEVLKETKGKVKKLIVGYRMLEAVGIVECAFADDVALLAKNEKDLQHNLQVWNEALKRRNLRLNVEKTKVMVIGKQGTKIEMKLEDCSIEQVELCKYLGVKLQENGRNDAEINDRIESATKLYYALNNKFIRNKEISRKTKTTVYKTIFKPILIYGSESWVLTQQMKSRIQAIEMKYLRSIKGITKRDRIRNETIREELEIEPVANGIERQQLKWFGHLIRMNDERQPKKIWQAGTIKKRIRGRPKKTWTDVVSEILRKKGLSWNEAKSAARNKKEWAKIVYE